MKRLLMLSQFSSQLIVMGLLCTVLGMLILPLPAVILDICFTINIALGLIILLAAFYCRRPIEFAVFPSIVLFATLLRLCLNVASTRIVLLNGHISPDAAGDVIQSFAGIVIGGNYTVGMVVFFVFVIINFIVITKGANRVSEVSARFTLDALPGKQLAVDADLKSGVIDQEQAKQRRDELNQESNFYGAMDGASKFVRGDAVACILILFINLIGGVLIGSLQHDMALTDAIKRYFLLTVGDGLVAQIPALLISTATALIVTRTTLAQNLGHEINQQLFKQPKNLFITAVIIAIIAAFPGMPHTVFLLFASVLFISGYVIQAQQNVAPQMMAAVDDKPIKATPLGWQDIHLSNPIEISLGYRLLLESQRDPQFILDLNTMRRGVSQHYGFVIPGTRVIDDLSLSSNAFQIRIHGVVISSGVLDAQNDLRQLVRRIKTSLLDNLEELLDYDVFAMLLQKLQQSHPHTAEAFQHCHVNQNHLLLALKCLLKERIPLTLLPKIIENICLHAQPDHCPAMLAESLRDFLIPVIQQNLSKTCSNWQVIRLSDEVEHLLLQSQDRGDLTDYATVESILSERLANLVSDSRALHDETIVVVQAELRLQLATQLRRLGYRGMVIASQELPNDFLTQQKIELGKIT